ncbi:MAG TPA: arginine--tRNA ligase, partial [Candidatus Campbellbacteria bacterium]|nr:arginine--tRNA ligase [Candidatus Campbellbacteria bacterium]
MALMVRRILKSEIEKAVKKLYGPHGRIRFSVSVNGKFGDYSSNVAMVAGGNPKENAQKIKEELEKSKKFNQYIEKTEIVNGFLNFTLSKEGLMKGLKSLGKKKKTAKGEPHRKRINVEFISANPTGELHVGHARSAFFGDALANTLEAAGHKVEREYFINDSKESTQIKELGKTVLGKGESYLTDYLKFKIKNYLKIANLKIKNLNESEAGYLIAKEIQKDNREFITKKLGIRFDKWFSEERELRKKGAFEKTLSLLKKKKVVYEKDGALWLKTSEFGDDEDRVLVRSDGSVSYFLSDIAYHINKFKRGYGVVID